MPNCKSCDVQISEGQANASFFALSFLPMNGRKQERAKAIKMAERMGPLCAKCLEPRNDLGTSTEK